MTLLNDHAVGGGGGAGAKKHGSSPIAQLIPNRLYFASFESRPQDSVDAVFYWLKSDEEIHYDAFYDDFGPLNLSVLFRFCQSLNKLLKTEQKRKVFVAVDSEPRSRVNGAYLVAAFLVVYHQLTADQAYLRVQAAEPPQFIGFRDAALGPPSYLLHLQDVVKSVEKAVQLRWIDFNTFDPCEYEFYERVENGDFNWIIPGKLLSFCGPHEQSYSENGYPYHSPEVYFGYFKARNVSTIVRLNKKIYSAKKFVDAGFDHRDLFFVDGSTPNDDIVRNFIEIVDNAKGAVAVHCKAGLGRTGTLIACWMMKNFKLTAPVCMAWLRICRPGSVIGPQQEFLIEKQPWCWRFESSSRVLGQPPKFGATKEAGISTTPVKATRMLPRTIIPPTEEDNGRAMQREEGNMNANMPHAYPLRSRTSGSNINPNQQAYDETAVNELGQSQGDRLCEMKARAQHSHRYAHAPVPPPSAVQPIPAPHVSLEGESVPTTPTRTGAPARFSSETTPIKQLRLSTTRVSAQPPSSSVFRTGAPKPFPGFRTINFGTQRTPISKVTVGMSSSANTRPSILRGNLSKQKMATARNKPYLTTTTTQHHHRGGAVDDLFPEDFINPATSFLAHPTPPKHLMSTNSSISGTITAAAISIANKKYGLRPRNPLHHMAPSKH